MSSVSGKPGIEILRISVTLIALAVVVAVVLGAVHALTAPVAARLEEQRLSETLNGLIEGAAVIEETEGFEPSITTGNVQVPVKTVYVVEDAAGAVLGYCVEVLPFGYEDVIDMIVAVNAGGAVCGVEIISHSETPGSGAKIESDEDFRQSVYGLDDTASAVKSDSAGKGEVQVISGATVSSTAYINGVNAAIEVVNRLEQEVSN